MDETRFSWESAQRKGWAREGGMTLCPICAMRLREPCACQYDTEDYKPGNKPIRVSPLCHRHGGRA